MGDEDATFDLKLTIQKLQEELNLYRNGTTAGDLLEMLEEKDRDIRKLKDSIATKDTFLSKLAKAAEQSMCELDRMRKEKKGMEEPKGPGPDLKRHSRLLPAPAGASRSAVSIR